MKFTHIGKFRRFGRIITAWQIMK